MDLKQLRVFLEVAEQQSMTRAADRLHIVQPMVSKAITQLEQELGESLFIRRSRGVSLSPVGTLFHHHVENAIRELDNACLEIRDLADKPTGTLRLLILSGSALLPDMLLAFSKLYPNVHFELLQHISETEYDLCISYVPEEEPLEHGSVLLREEVMLAVPCESPLAKHEIIDLEIAREENFICMRTGSPLRVLSDKLCKSAGFLPNIVYESDTPATIRGLMQLGLGVAFLPQVTWHSIVDSRIKPLHINNPAASRRLCITRHRSRRETQAASIFQRFAVKFFTDFKDALTSEILP